MPPAHMTETNLAIAFVWHARWPPLTRPPTHSPTPTYTHAHTRTHSHSAVEARQLGTEMWDDSMHFLAGTMNGLLPPNAKLTNEQLVDDFGTGKNVLTADAKALHGLAHLVSSPSAQTARRTPPPARARACTHAHACAMLLAIMPQNPD